jgi:thiol:disulfide interchange protein DsbD
VVPTAARGLKEPSRSDNEEVIIVSCGNPFGLERQPQVPKEDSVNARRPIAWSLFILVSIMLLPALAWADGSNTAAFSDSASKGLAFALGASFVAGVGASLTPCVFPMVPITVSIFGATETQSRARGAALSGTFVLGIAIPFTILGVVSAQSGKLMGGALANPIVVSVIAVIFIALSSSMFGAFEMTLPSSITNKASTVGGVGFKGAFVLGAVMSVIAAPCTGPFLTGMILWISSTQNLVLGGVAMFSFALGLGLPFFIAGTFAVNLPKGGAWMLGIKWGSGVLLAYMALAYLRDGFPNIIGRLVSKNTTYGVIGGIIFAVGLGFGIVHVMAERRRSPIAHLSKRMKLLSIVPSIVGAFMFVNFATKMIAGAGVVTDAAAAEADKTLPIPKAVTEKKPVLIDFGASWCTACKELEEMTWPDARVRQQTSRFVSVKVDMSDDESEDTKRLQKKYNVKGLPVVIMLDSTGKEITRYTEFVPADKLTDAIKKVN